MSAHVCYLCTKSVQAQRAAVLLRFLGLWRLGVLKKDLTQRR